MDSINITNFKKFYEFLQTYEEPHIINWLKEPWKGKDKQESLLRLFAGLGLISKLNSFIICKGNFNSKTIQKHENIRDIFYNKKGYLIRLKDKGNSSDLTCIRKDNDKHLLLTTSKNINKLNVGKLDIDKILTNFQQYNDQYTFTLCIVIRDRNDYINMKKNIENTNQQLINILNKEVIIIDWSDLNEAYHNFKSCFGNIDIKTIKNNEIDNPPLILKMHQKLSVIKTLKLKQNKQDKILWGHIQRSGKSYIIGGCIIEDSKGKDNCNYLIITLAPNETIEQYIKVLECSQLRSFNIIYLHGNNKNPDLTDKNIIICSKQFLQTKIGDTSKERTKTISWLKQMDFEMRFIDESHYGGTTPLAQKTLQYYGNTFTIQITATYSKPINNYNIPKENWILWDLEDIKLCKNIDDEKNKRRLIEKHGNEIIDILTQYSINNIITEYSKFPELWIITNEIKSDITDEIIKNTQNNNYGWSCEACFLLKQGTQLNKSGKNEIITKAEFQNSNENLKMWYTIFGKRDHLGIPDEQYPDNIVFMKRIEKICKNPSINSRFIDNYDEPMIIMAFLPQKDIFKISKATKKILEKNNVIPDYEIVSINSRLTNDPKQKIHDAKIKAKNSNKKGVLVLSGRQCSLGVSIDTCDIVLLLNNNIGFDIIYQMMFRCMTEAKNKKCGFVIDMNIHRVIETSLIDYASLIKPEQHPKEAIQYILQERLITLNGDHWIPNFNNANDKLIKLSQNLYNIYSLNTEQALKHFLDRLKFKQILLTKEEQKIFNIMFNNVKPTKEQKELIEELLKEEENIKEGIEKEEVVNEANNQNEEAKEHEEEKEEKNKINYMDILKHIIPLLCILTIHNKETSFIEMFKLIENNKYIYNILIDQTKSWWGNNIDSYTIKKFINVYLKYVKNDKETNQIIRTIKELFNKNINNSKQLSVLIDKYLIPQELEKKKNAEISTPYKLRQEMLDKMPKEYWTKPNKTFEPCCGKGGFLIDIIDRFMDGLVEEEKNEKKRYKLIVEKCLYWADINPTNIFICKLLLDPYNDYKLNYSEGNTLELNIKEKWGLEGFDAVIGNPPYNNELWSKFVDKSLTVLFKNGYLLYVHPANWRKPEHKIGSIMLQLNMLYIKIYNIKNTYNIFNCNVRVDWYLLNKNKNDELLTTIIDDKNKKKLINTKKMHFVPNNLINVINKICSCDGNKLNIIRSHKIISNSKKLKDKQDNIYKYKVLTNLNSKGKRIKYINIPHSDWDKNKILMSYSLNLYPFYDNELSPTEHIFYQLVKDEEHGINLIKYLNSKLFKSILNACKWIGYQTDHKIFKYIPDISTMIIIKNDSDVYKYFNLTTEEIELIEKTI